MKRITLYSLVVLVSGCATTRTEYKPHDNSGGYSENRIDERISVARFAGNAYTRAKDAATFSQFRAVELCKERGYRFAKIYGVENLSSQQTVQRTSNYNYTTPTHFSGSANSHTDFNAYGGGFGQANTATNFSGTAYGGDQYGGSTSWNETFHYPTFDTYFSCTNSAFMTKVKLKIVSPENMKPFVNDLMGSVQVEDFMTGSPNRSMLNVGDFIIKVNGSRVQTHSQFASSIDSAKDKNRIPMTVVRDGKLKSLVARAVDNSSWMEEETNNLIVSACAFPEIRERTICQSRIPASR